MLLFEICCVLDIHSQSQATCTPSAQQLCGYVMVPILETAALYFCDCQGWAEVMVIAFVALCMPRLCRWTEGLSHVSVRWGMEFSSSFASQTRADMGTTELADYWLALGHGCAGCFWPSPLSDFCTKLRDLMDELDSQLSHPQGPVIYQWITWGQLLKSLY